MYICIYIYIHIYICIYIHWPKYLDDQERQLARETKHICWVMTRYSKDVGQTIFWLMGWQQLAGSLKLLVFFAKESYKRDYILQNRPVILRSLLIVATPYHLMRQTKRITPLQLLSHSYLPHSTNMQDTKEQCNMQDTYKQHARHGSATRATKGMTAQQVTQEPAAPHRPRCRLGPMRQRQPFCSRHTSPSHPFVRNPTPVCAQHGTFVYHAPAPRTCRQRQ